MLDECYTRAQKLISDNREKLEAVVAALLERETLSREEFVAIMEGRELPPLTEAEKLKPAETAPVPDPAVTGEAKGNGESERNARNRVLPYFGRDAQEGDAFLEPKE
jgi:cell division protease FtsH